MALFGILQNVDSSQMEPVEMAKIVRLFILNLQMRPQLQNQLRNQLLADSVLKLPQRREMLRTGGPTKEEMHRTGGE